MKNRLIIRRGFVLLWTLILSGCGLSIPSLSDLSTGLPTDLGNPIPQITIAPLPTVAAQPEPPVIGLPQLPITPPLPLATLAPSNTSSKESDLSSTIRFEECSSGGVYSDSHGFLQESNASCLISDSLNHPSNYSLGLGQAWASKITPIIESRVYNYAVLALVSSGDVIHYLVPDLASLASGENWLVASSTSMGGFPLGISFSPAKQLVIPSLIANQLSRLLNIQNPLSYTKDWCSQVVIGCLSDGTYPMGARLSFTNGRLQYRVSGVISNGNESALLTSASYPQQQDAAWVNGAADTNESNSYLLSIGANILIQYRNNTGESTVWSTNLSYP